MQSIVRRKPWVLPEAEVMEQIEGLVDWKIGTQRF